MLPQPEHPPNTVEMVSQLNLDITGIGNEVAAAVTKALQNVTGAGVSFQTSKQLGEKIGEVVGKHVAAALHAAAKELPDKPTLDVTALREQIFGTSVFTPLSVTFADRVFQRTPSFCTSSSTTAGHTSRDLD